MSPSTYIWLEGAKSVKPVQRYWAYRPILAERVHLDPDPVLVVRSRIHGPKRVRFRTLEQDVRPLQQGWHPDPVVFGPAMASTSERLPVQL